MNKGAAQMNTNQPLYQAYCEGREAYNIGSLELANPYQGEMAAEWKRGYRNTRKHVRFAATIKARQDAMK